MIKNYIIAGLVITTLVFAGLYVFKPVQYGASPGPEHYNAEYFYNGLTSSGGSFTATGDNRILSPVLTGASSTLSGTATVSITAAQACDNSIVTLTASTTGASTLTLPTAATMFADCLTTNGDEITLYARNLSASTTVITAAASTTINIDSGGTVTLGALGTARITFIRLTDILMWAFVTVFIP